MDSSSKARREPSTIRDIAAITIAGFLLLSPGAAAIDLFNPDEPREAEIAREMGISGDLIVPHFNDCPFLEKPPLYYWLLLAAGRLPMLGEAMAVRLPSVFAALGMLIVVYCLGTELYDRRTGRAGALLMLTTSQFWWLGKRGVLDMTLAFLVATVMLGILMADRRTSGIRWLALACAAACGAALTKGLVGILIPALALVVSQLWKRRAARRGQVGATAASLPWQSFSVSSFALRLLAVVVLPLLALGAWMALLASRPDGACFVREFLVENHVRRFLGGGHGGHAQPPWYYLGSLAVDYQPWCFFLPGAVIGLWPGRRRVGDSRANSRRANRIGADPIGGDRVDTDPTLHAWLLPALLVLSMASTKRSIYLLPLAAPMSLLVAAWWRKTLGRARPVGGRASRDLSPDGSASRVSFGLIVPGVLLAGLGVLVSAALPPLLAALLSGKAPSSAREAVSNAMSMPWTLVPGALLLAGVLAVVFRARRDIRKGGAWALALAGVLLITAGAVILPIAGPLVSAREIGGALARERARGARIAASGLSEGALGQFLYYSQGTVEWINPRSRRAQSACTDCRLRISPEVWLSGHGRRICLMTRSELERIGSTPDRSVLLERSVGGSRYVLVTTGESRRSPP